MSSKMNSFLKWSVIIIGVLFLVVQAYSVFVNPISTEHAIYYEINDGVDCEGFIIRNEQVLKSDSDLSVSYTVEDGGRVAKGSVVAEVYSDETTAQNKLELNRIEAEIDSLKKAQNNTNLEAADLSVINSKITFNMLEMLSNFQNGNLAVSKTYSTDLLDYMNRCQIVTGAEDSYESLIAKLETEAQKYESGVKKSKKTIKTDASGYFVSTVDGYENAFRVIDLETITADDIAAIKPDTSVSENAIGKIIKGFTWYIAITLPVEDAAGFNEGATVKIATELKTCNEFQATVNSVNRENSSEKAVMVVSCESMNAELAGLRSLPIRLIKQSYEGLRVSRRAIRVVDQQNGVYVVSGMTAEFVPVKILYSSESFVICELVTTEEKHLKIYDEVIVKGKNIYDGKIIE